MELFIAKGVPMRAAHEAVGKLVRLCEDRKCRLVDLPGAAFDEVQAGLGAGGWQGFGRGQCAQGFSQLWVDSTDGGSAAAGGVAGAADGQGD